MPGKQKKHDQEAGFTLVEAAIAALVLLVAIVFVAQLFVTSMQQNKASRQFTHATALAQSKLEELNAVPLEKLAYGGDLGPRDGEGTGQGTPGYFDFVAVDRNGSDRAGVVANRAEATYARYWKIEPDPEGWDGLYRITVRVSAIAVGRGSAREEVTLSTIRAQY
jgi:type II secretory pathway pseudopilin PulG